MTATVVSGNEIDLNWTNNDANAGGIDLERSADGGSSWSQIGSINPTPGAAAFVDTNVYATSTYKYRARAEEFDSDLDETLFSTYTNQGSATIPFLAPTDPTAAAVSGSEIDLAWTNNADNAGFVEVQRSADGGATWNQIGSVSPALGTATFVDTDVYPTSTYQYKVRTEVYNGDLVASVDTDYTETAPASIEFLAPTNLTGSAVSGNEIDLAWINKADNAGAVFVERSADGGSSWSQIGSVSAAQGPSTYQDTGAGGGTSWYRVRAETYNNDLGAIVHTNYANAAGAQLPTVVSASANSISAVAGTEFSGMVATFTSNNAAATAGDFVATIDWNDGLSNDTGVVEPDGNGGFLVVGSHTYAASGSYAMAVTISPMDGDTATASPTASVDDPATQPDAPEVWITASQPNASRPGPTASAVNGQFKVYRYAQDKSAALTVYFTVDTTSADAAQPGTDYQTLAGQSATDATLYSVVIGAGDEFATIDVVPLYNSAATAPKPVLVEIVSDPGNSLGNPPSYTFSGSCAAVWIAPPPHLEIPYSDGSGGVLPTSLQHSTGGYVPVNDDNDAYKFDGNGNPIPDKNSTAILGGDPDLLMIEIVGPAGQYSIHYDSTELKLWRENAKIPGDELSSDATFNLVGTDPFKLYVEGLTESATAGADQISLRMLQGGQGMVQTDTANFTVYTLSGPQDVPGDSQYNYKSDVPGGGINEWDTSGGSITGKTAVAGSQSSNADVLWQNGAGTQGFRGVVTFYPAEGFSVHRYINVVRIILQDTTVRYQSAPTQRRFFDSNRIDSNPHTSAVFEFAHVAAYGALVNGEPRGLKRIDMGYIQNVHDAQVNADFAAFHIERVGSTEGMSFLDGNTDAVPWYHDGPSFYHSFTSDTASILPMYLDDTPALAPVDTMKLWNGILYAEVSAFHLYANFNTYFAVHTKDTDNGAAGVYTERAEVAWSFNGSGTFPGTPETWVPDPGAGVGGDDAFTEVQDGTRVPVVAGPVANDVTTVFTNHALP